MLWIQFKQRALYVAGLVLPLLLLLLLASFNTHTGKHRAPVTGNSSFSQEEANLLLADYIIAAEAPAPLLTPEYIQVYSATGDLLFDWHLTPYQAPDGHIARMLRHCTLLVNQGNTAILLYLKAGV